MTLESRIRQLEQCLATPDMQAQRDREAFEVMVVIAKEEGVITGLNYSQLLGALPPARQSSFYDDDTKDRLRRLVVKLLQPLSEADQRQLQTTWSRFAGEMPFPWKTNDAASEIIR